MSILLSADGLRKIAMMLDRLTEIEVETGVAVDGGYNGHTIATLPEKNGGDSEALRVVRATMPDSDELAGYCLEIEVS